MFWRGTYVICPIVLAVLWCAIVPTEDADLEAFVGDSEEWSNPESTAIPRPIAVGWSPSACVASARIRNKPGSRVGSRLGALRAVFLKGPSSLSSRPLPRSEVTTRPSSRVVHASTATEGIRLPIGCRYSASGSGDISIEGSLTWKDLETNDVDERGWSASGMDALSSSYVTCIEPTGHEMLVTCTAVYSFAQFQQTMQRRSSVTTWGIPKGETTASSGWWEEQDTFHKWTQTLIGGNFGGRTVYETDGGGGADTCWYEGSPIPKFAAVSGASDRWDVGNDNRWGPDLVGWSTGAREHYRNAGVVPCDTTFLQGMYVSMPENRASLYATNWLRAGITWTTVWSERAGQYAERVWP